MTTEQSPTPVPQGATQVGEVRARWGWTEPCVWTDRMLTALEQGVKGDVWFSLIDKVWAPPTLAAACDRVVRNQGAAGVDHVRVAQFARQREPNLDRLTAQLRQGTYRPQAVRRVLIPKPGSTEQRPLGIPTVRDRVVQGALRLVLEPIFEQQFADHSYGFRPGRGCKDALRRVDALLGAGYHYVVDADLKRYFDTIPHDRLLARLRERVADGRVLALVAAFLTAGVLEGLREWTPTAGAPQGAVLSPLLSNIYLDPLDHAVAAAGFAMVRYADDFVILCRTPEQAQQALGLVRQWVEANGLVLHPDKTRIVDAAREGFDFLGYRFAHGRHRPSTKSLGKLQDTVRAKTRRTRGDRLDCTLADVSRTLRGWFAYFRHGPRGCFRCLDGWIRMRLRSLLRRRQGGRGRGRGWDHHRWPKAFFAARGLFSLEAAHVAACQSPRG